MKDKHEFDEYPGEKLDWTKGVNRAGFAGDPNS
jgi:hypothetical protein